MVRDAVDSSVGDDYLEAGEPSLAANLARNECSDENVGGIKDDEEPGASDGEEGGLGGGRRRGGKGRHFSE